MPNNDFTTLRVGSKVHEKLKQLKFDFRVEEMNDVLEKLLERHEKLKQYEEGNENERRNKKSG